MPDTPPRLPLPRIRFEAVYSSTDDGGAGDGGGGGGGGGIWGQRHSADGDNGGGGDGSGGKIVISLTEIESLPTIEYVLNVFVDLERLKRLLLEVCCVLRVLSNRK